MRRSRKWNATLETAQRGRAAQARQRAASKKVKHAYNRCLTSPSRRTLEVAPLYLIPRDNPSEEGIRIHHYSS